MTAEPDPAELLRSLRAGPEQLTELRTLLLGDETDVRASLVTLADAQRRTEERVQELADAQRRTDERVQGLADAQRRLTDQVTHLSARVTDLEGQVATLTDQIATLTEQMAALTSQVAALTSQMAALTSQAGNLAGDVAWLRGDAWERRYRERGHVYFREIARTSVRSLGACVHSTRARPTTCSMPPSTKDVSQTKEPNRCASPMRSSGGGGEPTGRSSTSSWRSRSASSSTTSGEPANARTC